MPLKSRNSTYRFAVGEPGGEQSLVWRLWTHAAHSDAYLAARSLGGVLKVSLHVGAWRVAFVDPQSPFLAPGQDRAILKWERPPDRNGWTRAFAIGVPDSELTKPTTVAKAPEMDWFPRPGPEMTWNFDLFLATADAARGDWPSRREDGATIVHQAWLASGEVATLIARRGEVSENLKANIVEKKREMREAMLAAPPQTPHQPADTRAFLLSILDADGTPFFVDVAAPELGLQ
jgi:hypothetical protein